MAGPTFKCAAGTVTKKLCKCPAEKDDVSEEMARTGIEEAADAIRDLLELPITVPMDATLLLHGYRPAQVLDVWEEKLEWIKRMRGLATIVTHPEPHFSGNARMLGIYTHLLTHLTQDGDCWIAPLAAIADWWRRSTL